MMDQFHTQIRFLILSSFVTLVVVAGVIFGIDHKTTISTDLATQVISNREPMVFVNGREMDWTGLPIVHQVIQRKGTILRVRSYIQKVVQEKSSNAKAMSF